MLSEIEADLKTALLSGDKFKVSLLRGLKSELQNASIAKQGELSDEEIIKIIQKEQKKRREAAKLYAEAEEESRRDQEEREATLLEHYLPSQLSDEELTKVVNDTKMELGSEAHVGLIIKTVISKTAGRADGGRISALVNKL